MTATNQQPVAEICSASHDDAQFGERAIKPLCDISGFEYGTPLYAGAAPAAVAPQGEYPHEQMDAMALARYKVVPSHASMLWSHAVVAGDGVQQLYVGREAECQNMARKFAGAFLDGAFAFHSMAAAPTTQAAPALEAPAAPSRTSVAVLQCDCCGHIGINDAADGKAACNTCRWTGDSPAEDKCPGCNRVGTMTTACPECGARTTLIAETHLQAPAALEAPAAPESAPWCPDVCPITGRPFFMWIDHWQTGKPVPTYGGPYDSYTIPVKDSDGSFECERYDHDEGGWLTEGAGWHCLGVRLVDDQSFVVDPSNPRYHEIEAFAAAAPQAQASAPDWWRGRADEIEVQVAATGNSEAMRCYTDMRTLLQAAAAPQAPAQEAPAAPVLSIGPKLARIMGYREHYRTWGRQLSDATELVESHPSHWRIVAEAIDELADALAAAPQAPRLGEVALHLLRRLLSNQHTLTGPEFRAELEKIVAEESARHAAAPQAPAAPWAMPVMQVHPLETAPKDGTIVQLLVQFVNHPPGQKSVLNGAGPLYDTADPCWTIGGNTVENTGVDHWQFVGWNWEQDCFVDTSTDSGHRVLGWAPFDVAAPAAPAVDAPKELDPGLSREVYRACEDLPEGWAIRIDLENGYGGVVLIDPDGEESEPPVDGLLSDAMRESIAAAQAAAKGADHD